MDIVNKGISGNTGDLHPPRTRHWLRNLGLLFLLAGSLPVPSLARDDAASVAQGLVPFASEEGMARLSRSTAKADFPSLVNQFEAQSNTLFCGPTTAAIVLNAMRDRSITLPRDRSRLHSDDLRYLPTKIDPVIPRYTQDNVIPQGPKTRAQVMGEPVILGGKPVKDFGYQLRQFDAMLKGNGVRTRLVVVNDAIDEATVRADLVENLKRRGDYVVINYLRKAVGQPGGGHISPLAAYDRESDSFLILDVNPANADWVWMPTATLVKGMRTFDTVENRGYILVEPNPDPATGPR